MEKSNAFLLAEIYENQTNYAINWHHKNYEDCDKNVLHIQRLHLSRLETIERLIAELKHEERNITDALQYCKDFLDGKIKNE